MRPFLSKFLTLALLLAVSLSLLPQPIHAQDGTTIYIDPAERFSITLPADWVDISTDERVGTFSTPDGLTAAFTAVAAPEDTSGQAALLVLFGADASASPIETTTFTHSSGTWTQQVYLAEDQVGILISQHQDGISYGLYFVGTGEQLGAATPQLLDVIGTFTIGLPIDLSELTARTLTADDFADLAAYIEAAHVEFNIPGVSVAVIQNGEVVYTGGFGTLGVQDDQPVDDQTLFMIGSVTKSMTSFVAATLVDEGKLAWEQPVTEILPEFALADPTYTEQIQVRDLFNMSTGVAPQDSRLFMENPDVPQLIADLETMPILEPYGTKYQYHNHLYAIGGFASAVANGTPVEQADAGYSDLLQTRLFDPLGMTASTLDFEAAIANPNHALPTTYDLTTGDLTPAGLEIEHFVVPVAPAGAVWSNAVEMGEYLAMELRQGVGPDGTPLVSAENLLRTQTPEVSILGDSMQYCMGWLLEKYHGISLVWHNGGTTGFSSLAAFSPEAQLGVVVLTNRTGGDNFTQSIREYVFELAYSLEHTTSATHAATEAQSAATIQEQIASIVLLPLDVEAVTPYLGEYEDGVRVELREDELWLVGAFVEAPLLAFEGAGAGEYIAFNGAFGGVIIRFNSPNDQPQLMIVPPGEDDATAVVYHLLPVLVN